MKEKDKKYTAADFASYHSGSMPPGDMHALEKAALEDPFLDDALQGYQHSSSAENDLEELKSRFVRKRKKKKVLFLSSYAQNNWWRIAALFIIITGAGYFFYRINTSPAEDTIVINEIKTPATSEDSNALMKYDTMPASGIFSEKDLAAAFEQKEENHLKALKRQHDKGPPARVPKAESAPFNASVLKEKSGSIVDTIRSEIAREETDSAVLKEYVLSGKVTDETGNPVPFASVREKGNKNGTTADQEGKFFIRSNDSNVTAIVQAQGLKPETFSLNKDTEATILMKKPERQLTEVVVTAVGEKKSLKTPSSAQKSLDGKAAGLQTKTGLQPYGGKKKFDQYLKKNTIPVYDENNERLRGEVILSFTADEKGRPDNIRVLKSSCVACQTEAIRLLENGPHWTGERNNQGEIAIKF